MNSQSDEQGGNMNTCGAKKVTKLCESGVRKHLVVDPVRRRARRPPIPRASTLHTSDVLWSCAAWQPWFKRCIFFFKYNMLVKQKQICKWLPWITIIQFLIYRTLIQGCWNYQICGKIKANIFCVPTTRHVSSGMRKEAGGVENTLSFCLRI